MSNVVQLTVVLSDEKCVIVSDESEKNSAYSPLYFYWNRNGPPQQHRHFRSAWSGGWQGWPRRRIILSLTYDCKDIISALAWQWLSPSPEEGGGAGPEDDAGQTALLHRHRSPLTGHQDHLVHGTVRLPTLLYLHDRSLSWWQHTDQLPCLARSCGPHREKTSPGRQHRCLGNVDFSANLHPL